MAPVNEKKREAAKNKAQSSPDNQLTFLLFIYGLVSVFSTPWDGLISKLELRDQKFLKGGHF